METYEKLSDPLALAVFVLTLSLPVLIGVLALRRTRSQADFLLGGRAMGRVVVALSAVSSGRSSWLVLGVSGMAYKLGVGAVWAVLGYVVVEMLQFVVVGRRLRRESARTGALTLLDYLEARCPGRGHAIRATGAVIIGVFLTAYVAAQFNAGAKSLSTALELPLVVSLAIAGALVIVYMVLGGFVAVAYNDVVRAVIMIVGLVVFPAVGLARIGGLDALLQTLAALRPEHVDPWSIGAGALIGFLGIGLGSPGQPHIVVRYMSVDDPEQLRTSAVIGTLWNVVLGWGAVLIGLLGRAAVPDAAALPDGDPEMVYLVLSSRYFGPLMYGLLVGGIFAAILSTADSQLLVVASTLVRDVYEQIVRRDHPLDEARLLRLNRAVVVVAGLAALVLAYLAKDLVFWLVLFAWGGLGAAFGPPLLLALLWRRTSRAGIVAGMVTGALVTVAWKQSLIGGTSLKEITGIYELIVAFPASALAVALGSLVRPAARAARAAAGGVGGGLLICALALGIGAAGCTGDGPDDDDTVDVDPLEGLPTCDGGILDQVDEDGIHPPASGSGEYAPPDAAALQGMGASLDALVTGDVDAALELAAEVDYAICRGAGNEIDLALWRPAARGAGHAWVVFRARGARPLIVGNPHAWLEIGTVAECRAMFDQIDARALVVTGTHRCANEARTPCSGTTSVCGSDEPYRESDMAHVVDSAYQIAHEVLAERFTDDWVLSVHGFPLPGISLSNGTTHGADAGTPVALFGEALQGAYPGEQVTSCNSWPGADVSVRYCGTTNVQGRMINGSPDPCTQAASTSVERFMHLEQTFTIWLDPQPVIDALDSVVPR